MIEVVDFYYYVLSGILQLPLLKLPRVIYSSVFLKEKGKEKAKPKRGSVFETIRLHTVRTAMIRVEGNGRLGA